MISSKIVVVGSTNVDMIAQVEEMPKVGETKGGAKFMSAFGGKGANQAVAAARLGGKVAFSTCLGKDVYGETLEKYFISEGMDASVFNFSESSPTGTALILVDKFGNNSIAVAPGANGDLLPRDIEVLEDVIASAEYLLIQLEIPMETVEKAIEIAFRHGVKVVLNPAPMYPVSDELLSKLYLITPNETESSKLTGIDVDCEQKAAEAASLLMSKGISNVIITMGDKGAFIATPDETRIIPAREIDVVDTTAAGDVFNGALVTALSEGKDLFEAAWFATAASAISVSRMGAQPSIPRREEVEDLLTQS